MWFTTLLLCGLCDTVNGHGSMILPPARNSIDAELPAWSNGKHPMTGVIEPYNCHCSNGTDLCNNGQSCFWFSQGCTIGCKKCDGQGSRIPNWDHCPGDSINATLNDPKYRTANQNATPGSKEDIWKFNPWRAPGKAPVFDACGMAGGTWTEVFNAAAYNTTKYAKQGDLGSQVLKPRPMGIVWKAGSVAKTRWQLTAAHGGGYLYRLCPASEPLTEECFQAHPLEWASKTHTVVFKTGETRVINATVVEEGGGKGWMVNPLPYRTSMACDYRAQPGECKWKCPGCGAEHGDAAKDACPCDCSKKYPDLGLPAGGGGDDPYWLPNPVPGVDTHDYVIEDTVKVPNVPPGDYVVGWRWDCETTSQIWSSCADITIENPNYKPE